MRISGERCDGQVYIVPQDGNGFISHISKVAVGRLVSDIRESTCYDCPVFDVECNGIGRLERNGRVIEKKTSFAVSNTNCKIPKSRFEYSGEGIDITPIV